MYNSNTDNISLTMETIDDIYNNIKMIIVKEIVIAQKESTPTSRLTSLYNKISDMHDKATD